ncbi:sugar phosphate isomerase/epimerase family protein [Metabacillus endolithicus]|uniref:Sugar phosphate isomerase/epimerase family protein n=1 Tax=Metabacillus endolithicus TaxID=1535204 RepID=A0ABW5C428_9BACI|nr:sugar phosphate isomerase/epimerase [Metabacillus endolithicus]UPG62621.1 sugar phosphate isomerase/epimerase [Metabacillus endolithicus]
MKFGCSLEMINMRITEPGYTNKLTKKYWIELFKFASAVGFKGVELPYNPYTNDGIAFNMTRSGMPINKYAVNTKYGSVNSFMEILADVGIEQITGVHISAQDSLLELITTGQDPRKVFEKFEAAAEEAIGFLEEVDGKGLVISPTPELGLLHHLMGSKGENWEPSFLSKAADTINKIGKMASKSGVQASIKNEFWSLVRGNQLDRFMDELDSQHIFYSPDLAHLSIANENPVEVVKKYHDKLNFIRFSDTRFVDLEDNYKKPNPEIPKVGAQRVFCDLGDGKVDLQGVYHALTDTSYDGWVICESKKTLNVYKALLKMRWYIDNKLLKS